MASERLHTRRRLLCHVPQADAGVGAAAGEMLGVCGLGRMRVGGPAGGEEERRVRQAERGYSG